MEIRRESVVKLEPFPQNTKQSIQKKQWRLKVNFQLKKIKGWIRTFHISNEPHIAENK